MDNLSKSEEKFSHGKKVTKSGNTIYEYFLYEISDIQDPRTTNQFEETSGLLNGIELLSSLNLSQPSSIKTVNFIIHPFPDEY